MTLKKGAATGIDGFDWSPVQGVLEEVEQAVARGWYPARRELLTRLAGLPRAELPVWVPEADLEENPREFVVSFALPGVEKADIRVEVTKERLTVSGKRKEAKEGAGAHRLEQPRGEFLRRVRLPCEIKPQGATASYHNGVLRVALPRSKSSNGRSVKVD